MFQPVPIPFTSGLRQDQPTFGKGEPSWLREATNVVFTKQGAVHARQSRQSRDANVQVGNSGTAPASLLSVAFSGLTQAGIVGVPVPGTFGAKSPMVLWHGGQAIRTDSLWLKVGEHSFLRQSRSPTLRALNSTFNARQNPIPCGTNVVAVRNAPQGFFSGVPMLNAQNQVSQLITVNPSSWDSNSDANCAAAGDAVFYIRSTGDVRAATAGGDVSIGSGSAVSANPLQIISAVLDSTGTNAFVAFVSATAGRITLKKVVVATGSVSATLDVNGLGTVSGCSIAYLSSSGDKLVLAWVDTAAVAVKSKAFTSSGSTITDAAFDLTHAEVPNTTEVALTAGTSHNSQCIITFTGSLGELFWASRSFTAATGSDETPLYGSDANRLRWNPLFGAVAMGGRTYIGVQRRDGDLNADGVADIENQWLVLDVTRLAAAGAPPWSPKVVAMGRVFGNATVAPSQVGKPTATSIAFGVVQGLQFSTTDATLGAVVRIVLAQQAAALASAHGLSYFTGAAPGVFDGRVLDSHPFPETYPRITTLTETAAVGTLLGGSYSYQATWEMVNSAGQVVRSGASPVMTDASVAANAKITATITVPQLVEYPSTKHEVRVILWATQRNPTPGATLYEVGGAVFTAYPGAATTTIDHTAEVNTAGPQLYTVGGVLDDEPAPAGDRGIAEALDRIWVADQDRVYASKLLDQRYAPAWNTEGLLTIRVPSSVGEVQGLCGYSDHLLVIGASGIAVIRGAGFDDLGNGPGWSVEILDGVAVGAAQGTPRYVLSTPIGCVYQGSDTGLWTAGIGGTQRITSAVRDSANTIGALPYDLAYVSSALYQTGPGIGAEVLRETTPLLINGALGNLRVLDLEWQQWGLWSFSGLTGGYFAGLNGILWIQNASTVYSVDAGHATENGASVTSAITTGWHRVAGTDSGVGRVRKVVLNGTEYTEEATPWTAEIYADGVAGGTQLIGSGSGTWTYPDGLGWPYTQRPEIWTSIQRAGAVQIRLTFIPLYAEVTGVEILQWSGPGQSPNPTRA